MLTLFFLVGCVANRSYRRGTDVPKNSAQSIDPISSDQPDCKGIDNAKCIHVGRDSGPQKFYLAYIEFDDMGELWSIGDLKHPPTKGKSQLDNALDVIKNAKQRVESGQYNELMVVTFIHGWKNNASPWDENHKKSLYGFKTILQQLALEHPNREVVGVFIAWRGQSQTGDLFDTYWNRRDAAVRIGGPSMTEVMFRLMFATKGVQSPPDPAKGCQRSGLDPDSFFMAVGHSFGARILEHAMAQPLIAMILEQKFQAEECARSWHDEHPGAPLLTWQFEAPADLIVFINPANDAFGTKSLIEAFKRSQFTVDRINVDDRYGPMIPGPLLISMTSDGDKATSLAMPIAQALSIPGIPLRQYDPEACEFGQAELKGQKSLFQRNDANVSELRSHSVTWLKYSQDCPDEWPLFSAEVGGEKRCFQIRALKDMPTGGRSRDCHEKSETSHPWNDTPFYVIKVPSALIRSHTDIFQPGTTELLVAIWNHFKILESPASMSRKISSAAPGP
jgi:hypothetical protein